MSSTWSSGIGKFPKKDPEHGALWRKIKRKWHSLKCWLGLEKEKSPVEKVAEELGSEYFLQILKNPPKLTGKNLYSFTAPLHKDEECKEELTSEEVAEMNPGISVKQRSVSEMSEEDLKKAVPKAGKLPQVGQLKNENEN